MKIRDVPLEWRKWRRRMMIARENLAGEEVGVDEVEDGRTKGREGAETNCLEHLAQMKSAIQYSTPSTITTAC